MVDTPPVSPRISPASTPLQEPQNLKFEELQNIVRSEKPSIERPELVLIRMNKNLDALKNKMMGQEERSLKRENEAAIKASEEALAAAQQTNTSGSYYMDMLTSLVTSCFFWIRGSYTVNTNVLAGSLQFAAGTVGHVNSLLSHHYGWNWITDFLSIQTEERKDMLRRALPIIATGFMCSLAIAGMYVGSPNSASGIETYMKQFMLVLNTAVAIGQIPHTYLQAQAQNKAVNAQASFTLHQKNIEGIYRMLETLMDDFRRLSSILKKSFKATIQQTSAVASGM